MELEFTGMQIRDYVGNKESIEGKYFLNTKFAKPYRAVETAHRGARTFLKMEFPDGTIREDSLSKHGEDREVNNPTDLAALCDKSLASFEGVIA